MKNNSYKSILVIINWLIKIIYYKLIKVNIKAIIINNKVDFFGNNQVIYSYIIFLSKLFLCILYIYIKKVKKDILKLNFTLVLTSKIALSKI